MPFNVEPTRGLEQLTVAKQVDGLCVPASRNDGWTGSRRKSIICSMFLFE